MKGGKKRNSGGGTGSEALPEEAANGGDEPSAAPLDEKDQTQKAKEQGDQAQAQAQGQEEGGEAVVVVVAASAVEEAEEEAEEEEEEEEEDDDKGDEDGAPGEGSAAERPKLDDGYYEIEAIRRKRVRKGQLQYLIKWRGWPETANTWEPLENLQSCSDVIESFEESLRSGKHRKRKRKHGTPHTQPKKKQQRSAAAAYDVTGLEVSVIDEPLQSAPTKKSILNDLSSHPQSAYGGDTNGDTKTLETAKQASVENGCANVSQQIDKSKDGNEYDPKISELKATMSNNEVNMDKLAIHFQEPKALEGDGPVDGVSKVDGMEPGQSNRRTGSKRRKSGSVKRFKQDLRLCEPVVTRNANTRSVGSGSRGEQLGTRNPSFAGENSSRKNKIDDSKNSFGISKIIKPIGYAASVSNNVQDVSVTFMAVRSDGTEVVVDNKFLKANNPLLLINFYEQHLRYSPTSLDRGIDGE